MRGSALRILPDGLSVHGLYVFDAHPLRDIMLRAHGLSKGQGSGPLNCPALIASMGSMLSTKPLSDREE